MQIIHNSTGGSVSQLFLRNARFAFLRLIDQNKSVLFVIYNFYNFTNFMSSLEIVPIFLNCIFVSTPNLLNFKQRCFYGSFTTVFFP